MAILERSGTPDPGPVREPHGLDRGVVRTFAWWLNDDYANAQPGDVRLVTSALRCVGPLQYQRDTALVFEVIGVDTTEAATVLAPVESR